MTPVMKVVFQYLTECSSAAVSRVRRGSPSPPETTPTVPAWSSVPEWATTDRVCVFSYYDGNQDAFATRPAGPGDPMPFHVITEFDVRDPPPTRQQLLARLDGPDKDVKPDCTYNSDVAKAIRKGGPFVAAFEFGYGVPMARWKWIGVATLTTLWDKELWQQIVREGLEAGDPFAGLSSWQDVERVHSKLTECTKNSPEARTRSQTGAVHPVQPHKTPQRDHCIALLRETEFDVGLVCTNNNDGLRQDPTYIPGILRGLQTAIERMVYASYAHELVLQNPPGRPTWRQEVLHSIVLHLYSVSDAIDSYTRMGYYRDSNPKKDQNMFKFGDDFLDFAPPKPPASLRFGIYHPGTSEAFEAVSRAVSTTKPYGWHQTAAPSLPSRESVIKMIVYEEALVCELPDVVYEVRVRDTYFVAAFDESNGMTLVGMAMVSPGMTPDQFSEAAGALFKDPNSLDFLDDSGRKRYERAVGTCVVQKGLPADSPEQINHCRFMANGMRFEINYVCTNNAFTYRGSPNYIPHLLRGLIKNVERMAVDGWGCKAWEDAMRAAAREGTAVPSFGRFLSFVMLNLSATLFPAAKFARVGFTYAKDFERSRHMFKFGPAFHD